MVFASFGMTCKRNGEAGVSKSVANSLQVRELESEIGLETGDRLATRRTVNVSDRESHRQMATIKQPLSVRITSEESKANRSIAYLSNVIGGVLL